jgi:hypothetical protein
MPAQNICGANLTHRSKKMENLSQHPRPTYARETREVMTKGGEVIRLVYFSEFGGWVGVERSPFYNVPMFIPAYTDGALFTDHDLTYNLREIEDWFSMDEALRNQNYIDESGEEVWNSRRFVEEFLNINFGRIPGTEDPS